MNEKYRKVYMWIKKFEKILQNTSWFQEKGNNQIST